MPRSRTPVGRSMVTMKWDLWVDYMSADEQGLIHTNARYSEPGVVLEPGTYLVVGDEDADLAVAEVVTVRDEGTVLVRVLPGPLEEHIHLVSPHK